MQRKIVDNIKITPTEVKLYYSKTPQDSLPFYESEIEVSQIVMIPKANKDVEGGVSFIQNLIKEKRFKVCHNCKHTLEELNTYQYPEGVDGKPFKDVPEKMNDHLCDAARYALYSWKKNTRTFGQASPILKIYG